MANINSTLAFLAFVKRKYPTLYSAALNKSNEVSGLGEAVNSDPLMATADVQNQPWYLNVLNSVAETVKQLAPAYVGIQQAKTCIDVNAARAKQNLPPIDCASGGLTPQISVGISKEVQFIALAALGVLAIYLFMRK